MSTDTPPPGNNCPPPVCPPTPWPFRLLGIEPDPDRRFQLSLKPRFFGIIAGLILWFLLGMLGLTFYSTSPGFCNTCHIMEPYYEAWRTSSHGDIGCVNCHFSPNDSFMYIKMQGMSQVVKYVTRTYASKPVAEIDDASCLRSGCHSERLLDGKELTSKGVVFNHTPHLTSERKGQKLRCVSCHSQIMVGTHMEVTWDSCYLCHQQEVSGDQGAAGCTECHLAPLQFVSRGNVEIDHAELFLQGEENCSDCHRSVAAGQGEVSKYNCVLCHNKPENLARFEDVKFLHENHVTEHNVACHNCHRPIEHGANLDTGATGRSQCASCHPQRHTPEEAFYRGTATAGVPEMPGSMLLAGVQCAGCHPTSALDPLQPHQTAVGINCQQCHDPSYVRMTEAGQEEVKKTAALLASALSGGTTAPAAGAPTDDIGLALQTATSAHSAHNFFYAAALLRRAHELQSAAGTAPAAAAELPIISGQYCSTLCHQASGKAIPPETLKFEGLDYPHQMHAETIGDCNACHQFGPHKDPAFRGKAKCLECHDEEFFKPRQ